MTKKMGYRWHLRKVMASHDMFATTDLIPLLAERGIHLSREQVYRLVTTTPQRLNLDVLSALCDILDVGVEQLIEVVETGEQTAKPAATGDRPAPQVRRSTIRRPEGL